MNVRKPFRLGILGPDALRAPEIRDPRFGRDARASQRDNAGGLVYPAADGLDGFGIHLLFITRRRGGVSSRSRLPALSLSWQLQVVVSGFNRTWCPALAGPGV